MIINIQDEILFDKESLKLYLIKSSICLKLRKGTVPIISIPSKNILNYLKENKSKYDPKKVKYKFYGNNTPFLIQILGNGRRIICEGKEFRINGIVKRPVKEIVDYFFLLDKFYINYYVKRNNKKILVFELFKEGNNEFEYKIINKKLFNKKMFDFLSRQMPYFSKKLFSLGHIIRRRRKK